MAEQDKRRLIKAAATVAVWSTPVIRAVQLPAHAQTSCSAFDTEAVDEPIFITVSATDVRGPAVALRSGQNFSVSVETNGAQCTDNVTTSVNQIEFLGDIDTANNTMSGTFNVRQFCGPNLVCEQLATFTADQVTADPSSDLGDYQGRVTGTLRCCLDFI